MSDGIDFFKNKIPMIAPMSPFGSVNALRMGGFDEEIGIVMTDLDRDLNAAGSQDTAQPETDAHHLRPNTIDTERTRHGLSR